MLESSKISYVGWEATGIQVSDFDWSTTSWSLADLPYLSVKQLGRSSVVSDWTTMCWSLADPLYLSV